MQEGESLSEKALKTADKEGKQKAKEKGYVTKQTFRLPGRL